MKISRTMREVINTVIFLLAVALVVTVYIVYPLTRSRVQMVRTDIEEYSEDSTAVNDPDAWVEAGFMPDTFRVESDGLTTLAGLYASPDTAVIDSIRGTVFLLHGFDDTRDNMIPLAKMFSDFGYRIVAYDQRAAGRSTGKYHGEGWYEGQDLGAVISHLEIRSMIVHPLIVVGRDLGGDAGILAALDEERINMVAAVDPYLSTIRLQDRLKEKHDAYWFPFYRTIMWWWYNMRSSYAAPYRETEQLEAVPCPTVLFLSEDANESPEVKRLMELSEEGMLSIEPLPANDEALFEQLMGFVKGR